MQGLIVAVIVAAAACCAAWQFMSQRTRRRLIDRLAAIAPSHRHWLARLADGAGSGGCGSCKACAAGGTAPAAPSHSKIEVHRRAGTG
ncbi:MAG: hypothetical protein U1F15_11995 [Burkholderiales bacterium]